MARPLIHLTHDDACLIDAATDMLAALNELMPPAAELLGSKRR